MERTDNYTIQVQQAMAQFLKYDQAALIRKLSLESDEEYLYTSMLCKPYRIHRTTGRVSRQDGGTWVDTYAHNEVMTLLDFVCDSHKDRFVSGKWKQMTSFGLLFHRNLMENAADPFADALQADIPALRRALTALGGREMDQGDVSFALEFFDGLPIWVQFWAGDEEFPAHVRFLWDENALMYLKYETMYFAVSLLRQRILELMAR